MLKIKSKDHSKRVKKTVKDKLDLGYLWDSHIFQIDDSAQFNIAAKALNILKAQINNEDLPNLDWRTKDNTFYRFKSADEFLKFATEVEKYVEAILFEGWNRIDQS